MPVKLIVILFILIGIAGLVLPVVRRRYGILSRPYYAGIDWDWVKKEVLRTERIDAAAKDGRSNSIKTSLDECLRRARSLAVPKYFYAEKNILRIGNGFIEIEGSVIFSTGKIPSFISGASRLVLSVVTIGDGIEKEAGVLTSGKDILNGYLLDRIGSFAVESLAGNLEKKLRKDYSKHGKSLSVRFSPGYCDWPVEEQFKMIKAIDFSKAGVELTEGCMMVPKKSISAIAAVADKGVFKDSTSGCDICENKGCDFRRVI